MAAFAEGSKICAERAVASETDWRKKMEAEGVIFTEVDIKAFQDACAVVYTKFPEWSPGLYERIKNELAR
jgi:TRAP-type C4-dicarboxylate transport system substrate-binding protein